MVSKLLFEEYDDVTMCFLTHSVKEELEEIKEGCLLSVNPEERM